MISTRGHGWPMSVGRASSRFFQRADPADRFPLCAAVRKTDGDLKKAIDQAWEELHRSGQLARVFARWHIPYESRRGRLFEKRVGVVSRFSLTSLRCTRMVPGILLLGSLPCCRAACVPS